MKPEELLQGLINGEISPQEFKALATAPRWALIFYTVPTRENAGQMEPEDTAVVIIDSERKEMKWKEFAAFRDQWPDAEYLPPGFFTE